MRCSACGAANPDESRFCGGCGSPATPRRATPANAATVFGARADAAVAAHDGDAIEALIADRAVIVDHKTGRTFGREEQLSGFRALLSAARDPASRHEPLAVLGDSLALLHRTLSASGFGGRAPGTGGVRIEELCVVEADPHESLRARRCVRDRSPSRRRRASVRALCGTAS